MESRKPPEAVQTQDLREAACHSAPADQRLSLPEALYCAGLSLAGMFLARKRQAIRSPKQTWALRDSVPCDDGECGSAALQSPSAKRFCPSFFLKPVFIVLAPLGHCFNDRAQGLPQIAQDIFHTGRHLRIDGAGKDTILFHRAEAVREHLLANALQIPAQFIKAPGTLHQIADNQEFPLASESAVRRCHRASRYFFFCQHRSASFPGSD